MRVGITLKLAGAAPVAPVPAPVAAPRAVTGEVIDGHVCVPLKQRMRGEFGHFWDGKRWSNRRGVNVDAHYAKMGFTHWRPRDRQLAAMAWTQPATPAKEPAMVTDLNDYLIKRRMKMEASWGKMRSRPMQLAEDAQADLKAITAARALLMSYGLRVLDPLATD